MSTTEPVSPAPSPVPPVEPPVAPPLAAAPPQGRNYDFDAARAARREARAAAGVDTITIGGTAWPMAPELPLEVLESFARLASSHDVGGIVSALAQILGPDAMIAFTNLDPKPTYPDAEDLLLEAMSLYGMTEGNSGASPTP